MIEGWYYLHTNGSLIYKKDFGSTAADIRESDFARMLWPVSTDDREGAWTILVEALAMGANVTDVKSLAKKWGCDDNDAMVYAARVGVALSLDGDKMCATRLDFVDLMESTAGFGDTALEAMANLCKFLGFAPTKLGWHKGFKELLR